MKVLVVDELHPILYHEIAVNGWEAITELKLSREEFINKLSEVDGLIIRSKFKLDKEILFANQHLKFIGRAGSGLDNIDVKTCDKLGINLYRSPEGNAPSVAEHALGMMLNLLHKIKQSNNEVIDGVWHRRANWGTELSHLTVGLFGYGNTGNCTAKVLKNLSHRTIAYDKYKSNFSDEFCEDVSRETIFENADVLSLHIPLNNDTNNLISKEFISRFKKPFYLINTSRGSMVNISDLIEALDEGTILGAALDVLPIEKHNYESVELREEYINLLNRENVIVTPHIAGWSYQSFKRISSILIKKIIKDFS